MAFLQSNRRIILQFSIIVSGFKGSLVEPRQLTCCTAGSHNFEQIQEPWLQPRESILKTFTFWKFVVTSCSTEYLQFFTHNLCRVRAKNGKELKK